MAIRKETLQDRLERPAESSSACLSRFVRAGGTC